MWVDKVSSQKKGKHLYSHYYFEVKQLYRKTIKLKDTNLYAGSHTSGLFEVVNKTNILYTVIP